MNKLNSYQATLTWYRFIMMKYIIKQDDLIIMTKNNHLPKVSICLASAATNHRKCNLLD